MKKLLLVLLALTGCTTVYLPNGQSYVSMPSGHVLVNNTNYELDVTIDGVLTATVRSGQTLAVQERWLMPGTQVSVVAHERGVYMGASSHSFSTGTPETWQINYVERPREPQ